MIGNPLPEVATNQMYQWAEKLVRYLRVLERTIDPASPKSVQLEHRKINAKATTDGLIMWCPINNTIIVSKGGEWFPVTLGAALPTMGIKHNV